MIGAFPASRGHPQGQIEHPTWLAIPGAFILIIAIIAVVVNIF